MAVTQQQLPGGDNGPVTRFALAAGDTLRARLVDLVNFERGLVFTLVPAAGAEIAFDFSLDPDLRAKQPVSVRGEEGPFDAITSWHQTAPFQAFEARASGGDVEIYVLGDPRRGGTFQRF